MIFLIDARLAHLQHLVIVESCARRRKRLPGFSLGAAMKTVKISAPGNSGGAADIVDACTGAAIHGVCAADISVRPHKVTTVRLQVAFVEASIEGAAEYACFDPRDGAVKKIARIVFADGSEFVPE